MSWISEIGQTRVKFTCKKKRVVLPVVACSAAFMEIRRSISKSVPKTSSDQFIFNKMIKFKQPRKRLISPTNSHRWSRKSVERMSNELQDQIAMLQELESESESISLSLPEEIIDDDKYDRSYESQVKKIILNFYYLFNNSF